MLINFNDMKEITIPGINDGTGMMSVRMHINKEKKIILTKIHPDCSIGRYCLVLCIA